MKEDNFNKEYYDMTVKNIKKVVKYIRYGIHENDRVRKCNIYDYYLIVGSSLAKNNTNIYSFYKCKYISLSEYYTIEKFIEDQMMIVGTKNVDRILSMYFQYGDRVITEEEKKNILQELKDECIPINDITFSLAVRRYANATKDKVKSKKRVKNKRQ